ncbi:hypothetical protein B0H11DRAFT_1910021 [Mycena galericulata]|nr:hypothetical protein B0H11DRAFT_1910021 [Mycena galericulata]
MSHGHAEYMTESHLPFKCPVWCPQFIASTGAPEIEMETAKLKSRKRKAAVQLVSDILEDDTEVATHNSVRKHRKVEKASEASPHRKAKPGYSYESKMPLAAKKRSKNALSHDAPLAGSIVIRLAFNAWCPWNI